MALARFGGGVSELRGSIAGNVFSRSRAGAIVRNRAVPVNPNTGAQSLVRSYMQLAADAFKGLDKATVDEWNEFASTQTRINRLGEPYVPSGKQLFTETSLNFQILGDPAPSPDLASIEGNPNLPGLPQYELTLANTAGALTTMSIADLSTATGDSIVVQATPQMLPSFSNVKKYFRQIFAGAIGGASLNLLTAYTTFFPTSVSGPTVGNVIHVRARALNSTTGLGGAWIYASTVIPDEP